MRFNSRSTASTSRNKLLYVSGQRHDSDSTCFKYVASDLEATNVSSLQLANFTFLLITYFSTKEICLYSLYRKEAFIRLGKREKIDRSPYSLTRKITSHTSQAVKKSRHFLNVRAMERALITRKMCGQ